MSENQMRQFKSWIINRTCTKILMESKSFLKSKKDQENEYNHCFEKYSNVYEDLQSMSFKNQNIKKQIINQEFSII